MTSGAENNLRASAVGLGVALVIHSLAVVALSRVDGRWTRRSSEAAVEIEVNEPPPPPQPARERPPEAEPPPPPPARLRVVERQVVKPLNVRTPSPSAAPPPPNQAPPAGAPTSAPPIFGVTMSSVVSGEAGMAVPVGNTTMTNARARPTSTTPPAPYAGSAARPFAPVPDVYIATTAKLLREIDSEDVYPAEARTLGIEGFVDASLDIDEKGNVVAVRIVKRGEHGFDEAAKNALKQFLFQPARTSDGRAVPSRLIWKYRFTMNQ